MGPVAVVVLDVLMDDGSELSTPEDEHPIVTFTADGPDEALGEGIGTRSSDRRTDDPNALGAEDLVEAGCELASSIPDQELDRACTLGEFIGQVPGLLDHPGACRIRCHSHHEDLSGVEFDEEQDVEPPQRDGVHGEEVAGQHRGRLGFQELTPRRSGSVWRGIEAMALEDVPDAGGCQVDTQDGKLPVDTAIAPCRVLRGQANDQLAPSLGDLRAASGLRVGPLATDQLAMPTEQSVGLDEEPSAASLGGSAG